MKTLIILMTFLVDAQNRKLQNYEFDCSVVQYAWLTVEVHILLIRLSSLIVQMPVAPKNPN
jgi:hypothetical protein